MEKKRIKSQVLKPTRKLEKLIEIKHFLEKGNFPLNTNKINKNSLRQFAKRFILQDDRLYHLSERYGKRMAILNEANTHSIISDCHQDPDGSHYGLVTTFATISRSYYWPTMWRDTRFWMMSCPICQMPTDPVPDSLTAKTRWDTLILDQIGPFPLTSNGNTHLLLCVDVFSRYTIVCPLVDTSFEHIASSFIEHILYVYGQCSNLVVLQGEIFAEKLYNEIVFNLTMGETMMPHIELQAAAFDLAKFNQIKSSIELYMKEDLPNNWELYAKEFVYKLNSLKDTTTLESPFFLMFFRHSSVPDVSVEMVDVPTIEETTGERLNESRQKNIRWFDQQKKNVNNYALLEPQEFTINQ